MHEIDYAGRYEGGTGEHPKWMDDALCLEVDPEMFFPEKGQSPRDAKRICAKCEVREDCLLWALDRHERMGIWGGKTAKERAGMRARRRVA